MVSFHERRFCCFFPVMFGSIGEKGSNGLMRMIVYLELGYLLLA